MTSMSVNISNSTTAPVTPSSGITLFSSSNSLNIINSSGASSPINIQDNGNYLYVGTGSGAITSVASTGLGLNALSVSASGNNSALGYEAGKVYTGTYGIFIGAATASLLGTGDYNTIIGAQALQNLTTSSGGNTILGAFACALSNSLTTSIVEGYNACIGVDTITGSTIIGTVGFVNDYPGPLILDRVTAIGYDVRGTALSTLTQCTFVGNSSGTTSLTLTNSGAFGDSTIVTTSNSINIGHACYVGINNTAPVYSLDITNVSSVCALGMDTSSGAPASPASGRVAFYWDGTNLKYKNSAGVVKTITAV